MHMLIEFDIDGDIIDVPDFVIDDREVLSRRFYRWLSNRFIKHRYWVTAVDGTGKKFRGLCYRGDAFVEWLNMKPLKNHPQKAVLVRQHVPIDEYHGKLPSIFF